MEGRAPITLELDPSKARGLHQPEEKQGTPGTEACPMGHGEPPSPLQLCAQEADTVHRNDREERGQNSTTAKKITQHRGSEHSLVRLRGHFKALVSFLAWALLASQLVS